MARYQNLAIADPTELCFGRCSRPLTTRRGLTIGGGMVYPEWNFTLPTLLLEEATPPEVRNEYRQIITGAFQREAQRDGRLKIHPRELSWLDRIEKTVETILQKESEFIGEMMASVDSTKFVPAHYDL
jgi:hypothetical protein